MAEWSETVLNAVDTVVDTATTKVVRPAHKLARASVYGLVVAMLATLVLFFLVISVFRATTLAVDESIAYVIWGGIFLLLGTLLWIKK